MAVNQQALQKNEAPASDIMERVIAAGDLSKLSTEDRNRYYGAVCQSVGLNPLTRPFEYITLNNKLTLYARKDATDQLRSIHKVNVSIVSRERVDDVYVVTARAVTTDGRADESIGAVAIGNLKGDGLANALMKAECVPLDSEILTRNGFKSYDRLTVGEEVLAYSIESDECRWTPLEKVSVYSGVPTVEMSTLAGQFSVRCTPNHSWASHIITGRGRTRRALRRLVEAQALKTNHKIILAAPEPGGEHPLTPTEAAILGWVMCDGTIKQVGNSIRLGISQSKQDRVAEIRGLVSVSGMVVTEQAGKPTTRTFPSGNTYECLPQHWFYFSARDSKALLEKASLRDSRDLPRLATRMSHPARVAMLGAMLAADGDTRGNFGKKRKPGVMEAFQILATLEGMPLGSMRQSSAGEVPIQKLISSRYVAGSNLTVSPAGESDVWCPTTAFGTWVMRQNGRVMITGNTKAKRRVSLSICGLGFLDETEVETATQLATSTPPQRPTKAALVAAAPPPTSRPADAAQQNPEAAREALEQHVLSLAGELGYSRKKVDQWADRKYETTGGLGALGFKELNESVEIFSERRATMLLRDELLGDFQSAGWEAAAINEWVGERFDGRELGDLNADELRQARSDFKALIDQQAADREEVEIP